MPRAVYGFLMCLFGLHFVPKNWAFEDQAAIWVGGVCPRCGGVKYGKGICNTWTHEELMPDGSVNLMGFDISAAINRGYIVRGNIDSLLEESKEQKKKSAARR